MLRRLAATLACIATLALGACATSIPPGAGSNPADPYERMNRHVAEFNDRLDRNVLAPVARGYVAVVPQAARDCISNVFFNVGEIGNFVNATLQARPRDMAVDAGRFAVNSTAGLLGCIDVAGRFGWERNRQDFGLTFGRWGIPDGPYLVLPLLGPRSLRDAVGEVPDIYTGVTHYITPAAAAYETYAVYLTSRRAQLLDADSLLNDAAMDRYTFLRDAYLQNRRSRVHDGEPPPPPPPDDDPGDGPPPPSPGAAPAAQASTADAPAALSPAGAPPAPAGPDRQP